MGAAVLRNTLLFILAVMFNGQLVQADDANVRRLEQQLAATMRWEILWNDTPRGFQVPQGGSASLAAVVTSNSLAYCSHELGVCARYRNDPHRNWEREASAKCDGGQTDEDALIAFAGGTVRASAGSQSKVVLGGPGGLKGSPAPGSGIRWTAAVRLGSRDEIVQQYREMKPPEIEAIQKWARATSPPSAGYKSITIACFAPTDPMVYLYGDRGTKGSIVLAIYWDREREEWVFASSLERSQGTQRFDEMYRTIESVACSTFSL
ncbi:MAG: hypothetical protein ABI759_27820 [Candidatus Solibacter sp.]